MLNCGFLLTDEFLSLRIVKIVVNAPLSFNNVYNTFICNNHHSMPVVAYALLQFIRVMRNTFIQDGGKEHKADIGALLPQRLPRFNNMGGNNECNIPVFGKSATN